MSDPGATAVAGGAGAGTARQGPSFLGVAAAFLRRDLAEGASYRLAFVLRAFGFIIGLTTVYFTARFINLGHNPLLTPYGGDYFRFSLVGLILVDFQHVAVGAFARRIREGQTLGTLEALLATPAPLPAVLVAAPLYDFAAAALRAALYLGGGALFFGVRLDGANLGATALILLLTLGASISLGLCAGAFALLVRRADPITVFLGGISMLIGGVFYPRAALPPVLARLGDLLPITHALEAMRRALLAGAPISELGRPLGALAILCAVLAPLGLVIFAAALRRARVDGSLTHY
jgi:ABC-2 type transport system permease protein